MEAKFHRETAKIYEFVLGARSTERGPLVPNLAAADVVPIRSKSMSAAQVVAAKMTPRADFGSGWYHGAAIHDAEPPFRH